jgi:hypothetical protein
VESLRILLAGMVAGDPGQGGATWSVLQYVLGLRDLGHVVHLVEPVERLTPESIDYFERLATQFDLRDTSALLVAGSRETVGVPHERLAEVAAEADLLLNISGMLRDEELTGPPGVRVFLDLDPAFNQLWHAVEGVDMGFDLHNRFVTIGLGVGTPACPVPTCGHEWVTTLQPVHLPHWEAAEAIETDAFTTVGNWRAYGSIEWDGVQYGQRVHSMRELRELPELTDERLAPALAIHPDETDDLEMLERHGWDLLDPAAVAGTPDDYRAFVRGSRAELGIAKSGYVTSHCGWFSDRSACYLASGRPVVAQETGFGEVLPCGEGLLSYSTTDGAREAIERVRLDYATHARAARALAEESFDSAKVLPALLDRIS